MYAYIYKNKWRGIIPQRIGGESRPQAGQPPCPILEPGYGLRVYG